MARYGLKATVIYVSYFRESLAAAGLTSSNSAMMRCSRPSGHAAVVYVTGVYTLRRSFYD